ncbi:ATP-binding SpoIIE family protein phosphatase [Deinococcus sedimenti]|uniref:PPM-type phosphatase domain-containing protein n=1 Tax=Deinococcus sedimenti TaxID=1867090 RepID=A0ABQ2S8V3_9DEIO|nr:ATP-binding SpoIIE family protein phosphatase [Deinococcus sedimenti]GGS01399.1 hypothetical protein GCM10008960_30100 [Deinococcus sedimenti]
MSLAETPDALTELLDQVADLSDQLVFLQRLIPQALALTDESQATELVQQAAALINTPGAALNVRGAWLGDTPGWLRDLRPPAHAAVLPAGSVHTGAPFTGAWRLTSVLAVPLQDGWLALWGKRDFLAGERELIHTLAQLLDAALRAMVQRREAARYAMQERDRRQAREVWRAVTPEALRTPPGYHLLLHSQPASDFGGDFQFQEAEWLVAGDVSGKGLPAAIITAMFASAFTVAARSTSMNATLGEALHDHLERSGAFCTLAAMQVRPDGQLRVMNVGHPPVLLRRADGSLEETRASAPPLGTFPLLHVEVERVWLHPGDALLVYSDGLFEAEDAAGVPFGLDRTRQLASAVAPTSFIRQAVSGLRDYAVSDDLTLLVLQHDPGGRGVQRHLPGDLQALATLSEALREAVPPDHPALMPAELAVTELFVNAVRHGGAREVTLRAHTSGDDILVTLSDDGQPFDPRQQTLGAGGELREHGYGLLIVQRCAREWHYVRKQHLNRQTLRLRAPTLPAPPP